jgi:hypothetical protein
MSLNPSISCKSAITKPFSVKARVFNTLSDSFITDQLAADLEFFVILVSFRGFEFLSLRLFNSLQI